MRSDETPQRDLVRSGNFFGRVSAYVGLGWGELVGSYLSEDWKKLVRAQRRKMELIGMDHGLVGGTGEEMELVMWRKEKEKTDGSAGDALFTQTKKI